VRWCKPVPKVINITPIVHPLAKFVSAKLQTTKAQEFVVDDILAAGRVVVAGERGIGKTSALVPLLLTATDLLQNWPVTATVKRKVIYVSEDIDQVRRIVDALYEKSFLTCSAEELDNCFKLVDAQRLSAEEIVRVAPDYERLYTDNKRRDGTNLPAAPVICFDTTNATMDISDGNNNAEVSKTVATLREGFSGIPMVMVGHVAKATRKGIDNPTFVGAGSWEGDTTQNLYLIVDGEERYLKIGKNRFSAEITEYLLQSHVSEIRAEDPLGYFVDIKTFFAVPSPVCPDMKAEEKQQQKEAALKTRFVGFQKKVYYLVKDNPGIKQGALLEQIDGKDTSIRRAIIQLEEDGFIEVRSGDKNAKCHFLVLGGTGPNWAQIGRVTDDEEVPF
jgi:hypothetical protein